MPFYMWTGNYTQEAIQAMIKNPQDREAVARKVIEAAGGKLHHAFISLGSSDVLVIAELPDDASVAAVSLTVGAAGSLTNGATTKLLPMSEFVEAMKKAGAISGVYEPPKG